jgi:putative acetyltransferase
MVEARLLAHLCRRRCRRFASNSAVLGWLHCFMIQIRTVDDPSSIAAAQLLVRAHIAAIAGADGTEAHERVIAELPKPSVPPHGILWLAWEGTEALGCLALHEIGPHTAELKRMYVRSEARGRGVARQLTVHAIAVATARGYLRIRLGTLPDMHAAQQLYAGLGFKRVLPYRAVEFGETWFYERLIGPPLTPV